MGRIGWYVTPHGFQLDTLSKSCDNLHLPLGYPSKCSLNEAKKAIMKLRKRNINIFLLLFILGSGSFFNTAWAEPSGALKLDAARLSWTRLSFHAKNFWVEVSTDVHLESLPASEIETMMISTPSGIPVQPEAPEAYQMTIHTTIDPRFRSPVSIYNRIWFNPSDARTLGRMRLRRGEDDFKKIYRFTEQGVFRHRIEPKNKKEALRTPEEWTDMNDTFYPYDQDRLGCSGISERSLPIYILSAALASRLGDSLSICVFGKRQLHRVTLRKAGHHSIDVSFIQKNQQSETHTQKNVKSIKFTLKSEPMASDLREPENFSFLGFHKDISIYIDPASGFPIQASGMIPTAGKAILNLKKVWLKN